MDRKTLLLVLIGLLVRLFLIFPGPFGSKIGFFANQADLRNYYWPAQAVLQGDHPYALWASGHSGDFRADMAPLELVLYVATVAVWNDARAIQILFALFDLVNIILLGTLLKFSLLQRPFQIFYALGPLTLYNFVLVPADKTILLTLTFLIFYLLRLPQTTIWHGANWHVSSTDFIIPVAALLAAFKWLSVFYLLPLLLFVSKDWRAFIRNGIAFGVIVGLTHLPWIPDWLYVYTFRGERVAAPMHIAPAALLNSLGWYDKNILLIVLGLSLLMIYALFWRKRIDMYETIVLASAAGILWTPDMDPVHLVIVVIGLLLIIDWSSPRRLAIVWALSFWIAGVYAISTRSGFARYGLPDLRQWTGVYGSPQMILLSYVLFIGVFGFYVADKLRRHPTGGAVWQSKREIAS